ncbi:UNVERIFIED_CONTAM: hypothetical protein Slati_4223400 [Sesamum latifolium]|uniref:Reverse transcriptase domain-containing protein n=1 Tax=Sesamum latifolium TaxID=2727402 RepID=A0AAW2TAI7_9LAMI
MVPHEDGSETPCKVDVEYEWLPLKCTVCMTLGHSSKGCPTKKTRQPLVSVYVPKPVVGTRGPRDEPEQAAVPKMTAPAPVVGTDSMERRIGARLLSYIMPLRDHQVSVGNLVSEYRLQFIGLLETRVSVGNVARVQRGLLPRWSWFVDYVSPGNHIWLAWDEDFIDLNVLETGTPEAFGSGWIASWSMTGGWDVGRTRIMRAFMPELLITRPWFSMVITRHHIVGTTMLAVTRKLKALKPVFRAQRQKRGDLSNNVKLAAGFLEAAQHLLAQDRHSGIFLHLEFYYFTWGSQRDRLLDLRYLRPWARHIVLEEEARLLLLPVTADEIKQAVFDIDETKAPGPDGYSLGFFKAAWPIVGREVMKAIMNFFATGRLLKQVNSTLISLIPKVNNPTVVAEFWPITCCNVLYKVITKILVQRMRGILDTLVSPSENAFVLGGL